MNITFMYVDKSLCPEIEVNNVLLYDVSTMNEHFILSRLLLKSCST